MPSGEVLYIDGFDHYDQSEITYKWDFMSAAQTNWDIDTTTKRTGRASLRLPQNPNYKIQKGIKACRNATFGFAFYLDGIAANYGLCLLGNLTGTSCSVRIDEDGSVQFWRGSSADGNNLKESNSGEVVTSTWYHLECAVHSHQTLGTYEVRLDGVTLFSGEAEDTARWTSELISTVGFNGMTSDYTYIDDFYILSGEEFLGDMEVASLYPSGDGQYKQWTPSGETNNWDCVNEEPYSATEYILCSGENLIDTFNMSDLTEYIDNNIAAVQIVVAANKTTVGAETIKHVVRIGSTDYSGEDQAVPIGSAYKTKMYTLNPDDSQNWEFADINSAEFGIKRLP